jgi:hypothetical protein
MDRTWRRVGYDDVRPALSPERESQPADNGGHLLFRILLGSAIVPSRAFDPQDIHPVDPDQFIVQIDAVFRGAAFKAKVVISANIIKGGFEYVFQKREIFRRKITATQYKINPFKTFCFKLPVQSGHNDIGYCQDSHNTKIYTQMKNPGYRSGTVSFTPGATKGRRK